MVCGRWYVVDGMWSVSFGHILGNEKNKFNLLLNNLLLHCFFCWKMSSKGSTSKGGGPKRQKPNKRYLLPFSYKSNFNHNFGSLLVELDGPVS